MLNKLKTEYYIISMVMLVLLAVSGQVIAYHVKEPAPTRIWRSYVLTPVNHWNGRETHACEGCHCAGRFEPKCWWKNGDVLCSNCKHKPGVFKGNNHSQYSEVMPCQKCGHQGVMPTTHQEMNIPCERCGHGS